MMIAFALAVGMAAAASPAPGPDAAAMPAARAAAAPPPGAVAKAKPAMVCHSHMEVGSLLPVKVCSRPGERGADDLSKLELLQQRSFFKPRE